MTKKLDLNKLAIAVGGEVVTSDSSTHINKLSKFHSEAFKYLEEHGFKKPNAGDQSFRKLGNVEVMVDWRDGRTEYSLDVSVTGTNAGFGMGEWKAIKPGDKAIAIFKTQIDSVIAFAEALSVALKTKPKFLT